MTVLPGGIGLTWPNEVDFSADGLRQDAFAAEATGEAMQDATRFDEARRIAEVLEIAAPEPSSAEELQQWVSWWKPSYEAALSLSDEQRRYLKSGGWWPPLSAAQIDIAPDIVRRTQRFGLFTVS